VIASNSLATLANPSLPLRERDKPHMAWLSLAKALTKFDSVIFFMALRAN